MNNTNNNYVDIHTYSEKINFREQFEKYGFLPHFLPLKSMPDSHQIWDDYLNRLPSLVANKVIARELEKMPILDAGQLKGESLSRGAMILTYLAHAYAFEERYRLGTKIIDFPDCIEKPWATIAEQFNLRAPVGTIYDVSLVNWQLTTDEKIQQFFNNPESITLNDMEPLAKWFGTDTEKYFHLTITAMELAVIPIVRCISKILTAIDQQDNESIIEKLKEIIIAINKVTYTFKSLHLNSLHHTHVDSVLWSNSVAKFTETIREGMPGISGLGSPFFIMMDAFIERVKYDSDLGGLAKTEFFMLRPEHREFVSLIAQSPISAYINTLNNTNLAKETIQTLMHQIMLSYLGKTGLLPVHITKVSGYLTGMQFTTRHVTNAGHDVGEDHKIARMKQKFIESIEERKQEAKYAFNYLNAKKTVIKSFYNSLDKSTVSYIKLKLDKPLFIFPGAVCKVSPHQNAENIERVLMQLQLDANIPILLEKRWVNYFSKRGYVEIVNNNYYAKLRDVLKYTHITANTYHELNAIFSEGEQSDEAISKLLYKKLQLLRARYYSIAEHNGTQTSLANEVFFFVKTESFGVASQQMSNLDVSNVQVKIVPMPHAEYPLYNHSKKVIFAGGTGIATYMQYFEEAIHGTTLFLSVRTQEEFELYQPVLSKSNAINKLDIHVVCTRDHLLIRSPINVAHFDEPQFYDGNLLTHMQDQEIMVEVMQALERAHHHDALPICISGSSEFASAIMAHLRSVLGRLNPQLNLDQHMDGLVVNERIMISALGKQQPLESVFSMNELVLHNNALHGNWVTVGNGVYDLTRYIPIHPGGQLVLKQLSGMNISDKLNFFHGKNNQIYNMLEQYRIGQFKAVGCPLSIILSVCVKAENELALTQEYQSLDFNMVRIDRAKSVLRDVIKKILSMYKQPHFFKTMQKEEEFALFLDGHANSLSEQSTYEWSVKILHLFKEIFSVIKYYIRMFNEKIIDVNFSTLLNKIEKKYHDMAQVTTEYFDVEYNAISISGAGLGGVALAIALKQQGCDVHIYEKYNDPRFEAGETGGVSFNITLSERGLHVLEQLGLRQHAEKMSKKVTARKIYRQNDVVEQMYGPESEALFSIKRLNLLTLLLDKAESIGVKFHFNCELKDYEFSEEHVRFHVSDKRTNKQFSVQTPRVIGADGARSSLRNAIEDHLGLARTLIKENDFVYRELVLPVNTHHSFDSSKLHIWPKGQFMMMAFPNHDGSFALTLFVNKYCAEMDKLKNDRMFLINFIRQHFPQVQSQVGPLLWTESHKKWNSLLQIDCKQWHIDDKVLLIGDAAHAFYPFLGQAANCAMEDGFKLATLFKEGYSWKRAFETMQNRKKDTNAVAHLVQNHQTSLGAEPSDADMKRFELGLDVTKIAPFIKSTHANISFTCLGYEESIKKGSRHALTVQITEKLKASTSAINRSEEDVVIKAISYVSYLRLFATHCKEKNKRHDSNSVEMLIPEKRNVTRIDIGAKIEPLVLDELHEKCPFHVGKW